MTNLLSGEKPNDTAMNGGTSEPDTPAKKAGSKVRLLTLDDLDGRTRAAQFVRETRERLIEDLGGQDHLSTVKAILVTRYSIAEAMLNDMSARWLRGDDVDLNGFATLVNTANRTAAMIGIERKQRDVTPDLSTYLRDKGRSAA
jgi:hypothetical protein